MTPDQGRIWIQGAGELASGVAARLFWSGYRIVMAEIPNPLAVRRLVSFCEAVHEGAVTVEGIPGRLVLPQAAAFEPHHVTVVVDPDAETLARLGASAVIDARITKRTPVALPRGQAPLIGLGPGFTCGENADLIIETHRGARLGEVIAQGSAAPNTGIPGVLGGQSGKRVVRAPVAGHFQARVRLGDMVKAGEILGEMAGIPVASEIDGQVRGLVHPRAELSAGEKVGDVDPRGLDIDPRKISDKALAIGGGVLEALLRLRILPGFSQH